MKRFFQTALAAGMLGAAALGTAGWAVASERAPVILAQNADAAFRINQLEEQVRVLNGQVEEMTFQLLQLQEQLRKMQEDNEFRFQELENRGDANSGQQDVARENGGEEGLGKPQPSESADAGSDGTRPSLADLIEQSERQEGDAGLGAPPKPLGTLTFDSNGNLVDSNIGPLDLTLPDQTAALPADALPDNPAERFDLGYQYVQAGEYAKAEQVFRTYVSDFPGDQREPDATFWLGESLFAQGSYEDAARVFLDNHKRFPDAPLGAQNLLKLGVSLAGLEQRELACATYAEVGKKYPNMANAVRKRVSIEQQAAKCQNS